MTNAPLNQASYLHCYLSCPSSPWQTAQEESVGIFALTHSRTTGVERLKPSGSGRSGGQRCGGEARGQQCSRSTLSIVNHCHPSEATQLALHNANPLCSLFQPSVSQSGKGPHQKVLKLGIGVGAGGGREGGGEQRKEVLCSVCVRASCGQGQE